MYCKQKKNMLSGLQSIHVHCMFGEYTIQILPFWSATSWYMVQNVVLKWMQRLGYTRRQVAPQDSATKPLCVYYFQNKLLPHNMVKSHSDNFLQWCFMWKSVTAIYFPHNSFHELKPLISGTCCSYCWRKIGLCVLRVSMVECWSTLLIDTLNQHPDW